MLHESPSRLNRHKRYLQIALNGTLEDAFRIVTQIPRNEYVIFEVGTPMIKQYGMNAIRNIAAWVREPSGFSTAKSSKVPGLLQTIMEQAILSQTLNKDTPTAFPSSSLPYIVADMKMMDRGQTEVAMAAQAGASGVTALGSAPTESLNEFIKTCDEFGVDAMIDMMNVEFPIQVLSKLKKQPHVVILHRGVDETNLNPEKQLPLHEIRRIKGTYNTLIAVAGGDSIKETHRAFFNDADIVVVWKSFFQSSPETAELAREFIEELKNR
ncbi:MAG: orotidine 5'-phosphate decarboxylase [Parcubacteria group bacterium]|nr:orotidine 5'-phosphate decarboxylase [Parcubacteria group bacterium]